MAGHLPKACARQGCGNTSTDGHPLCVECRAAKAAEDKERDAQRKRTNPTSRLRAKRAWRDRLSPAMIAQNPICQRLDHNGEQCRNPSRVVHHLIAPGTDSRLFFDAKNLVALCETCHPSSEGTPDWIAGRDFVPTVLKIGMLG